MEHQGFGQDVPQATRFTDIDHQTTKVLHVRDLEAFDLMVRFQQVLVLMGKRNDLVMRVVEKECHVSLS